LGQTTETDTAFTVTPESVVVIDQAVESDLAQAVVVNLGAAVITINPGAESDAALPIEPTGQPIFVDARRAHYHVFDPAARLGLDNVNQLVRRLGKPHA
jgi:hypothetical protein